MNIDEIRKRHQACLKKIPELPPTRITGVRDLADQFYCEYQVHLAETEGEVKSPDKEIGRDMHEALREPAHSIPDNKVWEHIDEKQRALFVEFRITESIENVYFIGQVDFVQFLEGDPIVVIETKTSGKATPYPSQQMQAWVYARLFDEIGFDTDQLTYGVFTASKYTEVDDIPRDEYLRVADKAQDISEPQDIIMKTGSLHVRPYSQDDTFAVKSQEPHPNRLSEALSWALEWTRDERETTSTTIGTKCEPCDYRDVCDRAIHR
jgi:CRISPR/Cas system-associated exonuclease Cas4 (RecB family)